jgi:hypothetical protein
MMNGELARPPGAPWAMVLSALSGVALVRGAARVVGRVALAYRRPATLQLGPRGLEISHRTELLGKVLAERETIVPLANLASITREVRYSRLGLYAGLLALVLGTYVGTGFLVDGARVPGGSPSLIGMGLAAIAIGIILDYVLAVAVDAVKKTCQVIVRAHHGPAVCLRGLNVDEADRVLAEVARAASVLEGAGEARAESAPEVEPSPDPSAAVVAEPPT